MIKIQHKFLNDSLFNFIVIFNEKLLNVIIIKFNFLIFKMYVMFIYLNMLIIMKDRKF